MLKYKYPVLEKKKLALLRSLIIIIISITRVLHMKFKQMIHGRRQSMMNHNFFIFFFFLFPLCDRREFFIFLHAITLGNKMILTLGSTDQR